jgi:hypothetical protein
LGEGELVERLAPIGEDHGRRAARPGAAGRRGAFIIRVAHVSLYGPNQVTSKAKLDDFFLALIRPIEANVFIRRLDFYRFSVMLSIESQA